ncbi:MAG: cyclase family protein [Promethearchaeota archaeon]
MKIIDISRLISKDMLIYPGDAPFKVEYVAKAESGGWNLTKFSMGSHSGTHVDTPRHISNEGTTIASLDLTKCMGSCQVIDVSQIPFGGLILPKHLESFSIKYDDIILLKTKSSDLDSHIFREDFVSLSVEGAKYLKQIGVKTVGIDYLSIGDRATHEELLNNDIVVFENLSLVEVKAGSYQFIGLPLKMDTEGAPARAILICED